MVTAIVQNQQRKYSFALDRLQAFAVRLSQRLRIADSQFSVRLTNDRKIREFNRYFRKQDKATDVLSFPAHNSQEVDPGVENNYLGDMMISVETAQRQACDRGHSLEMEIRILMIHGLLHLLGYDHERDRGQMRRKELRLQRELL